MNVVKTIYVNRQDCVGIKSRESEFFKIDSGMRQSCILSPWLFNVYMGAVMKEEKMEMGRREENRD